MAVPLWAGLGRLGNCPGKLSLSLSVFLLMHFCYLFCFGKISKTFYKNSKAFYLDLSDMYQATPKVLEFLEFKYGFI